MLSPSERRAAYPQALSSQQAQRLQSTMLRNKYELYIISLYEMDKIIESAMKSGKKISEDLWKKVKWVAEKSANYYATSEDIITVTKIVGELGGIAAKVQIRNYKGKPHIIFKGNPELRKTLSKRVYKLKDARIVKLGLGRAPLINGIKEGGILTIYLVTAYRVLDYFLTDNMTLTQLVGTLATDIVKIGIATGLSIGAAMYATGAVLFSSFAIGPLIAVIIVGAATSYFLDKFDSDFHITKQVIEAIDNTVKSIHKNTNNLKRNVSRAIESEKRDALNFINRNFNHIIYQGEKILFREITKRIDNIFSMYPKL
ncbi:hypothetical protein [Marinomonas spartinae]|uniref:hypothetical protein n=1 Tax=Marinomonas spartinae TaxID=1792290 RepID=UPI0018F18CED|nr:hypothetical protein [Marinomonas spartinae]MBJ7554835.1 hypothetical protein [Marinomonas spartinae]